jgi:NADPH:quinone reductase-like Zn-dependent oxidoreductase
MSTHGMKAIRLHEFGGPDVLRYDEVAIPELKPGEVLVRVHAVGINPPDWYLRDGYKILPPKEAPSAPAGHSGDGRVGRRRGRRRGCTSLLHRR